VAYHYLKELLLDGGLEPGDQISAETVSKALSISRAPASDAIRRLAVDGLLEVRPQIGCRVKLPHPNDIEDFYILFAAAEAAIIGLAAARRPADQVDRLRHVATQLNNLDDLPLEPKLRAAELRQRNRRRYGLLHELAASPLSTSIAETLWDRSDFYIRVAYQHVGTPAYVRAAHRELIQAVIDGDTSTAEQTAKTYLTHLGRDIAALFRSDHQ